MLAQGAMDSDRDIFATDTVYDDVYDTDDNVYDVYYDVHEKMDVDYWDTPGTTRPNRPDDIW